MMKAIEWIAMILVIVGALNWGLIGIANYNLVETLLGSWPVVLSIVYDLVGLSGLWLIYYAYKSM